MNEYARSLLASLPENCLSCKFYRQASDETDEEPWGWCHRHPPTMMMVVDDDDEDLSVPTRPLVDEHEWCGEYVKVEQ